MLRMRFGFEDKRAMRVLCLGAHSDDIEIGCGGTLLKLLRERGDVAVHWVVLSAQGARSREARQSAARFLARARERHVIVKRFRDGFFPHAGAAIKEYFEALKREVSPDLIFTHWRHDLHQDHRLVSELTWNTYRDHLILEYEVLKYDGDLGNPNVYVPLDAAVCREKTGILGDSFGSQAGKGWFDAEAFRSLMRLRGVESRAPGRYAEAFYCRKIVLP